MREKTGKKGRYHDTDKYPNSCHTHAFYTGCASVVDDLYCRLVQRGRRCQNRQSEGTRNRPHLFWRVYDLVLDSDGRYPVSYDGLGKETQC